MHDDLLREKSMKNTLLRVSIFDGEQIVAMARVIGVMGLCAMPDKIPFYEKFGLSDLHPITKYFVLS